MTSNIFLATTALTDFWNIKSNKILFLGSWCTLYNRKQDWRNLNYEILDSPWKSKDDIIKGMKYCSKTYDILVERLAKYLNDVNNVNYETRYWKIIIGLWFATFLHLYYNHYICIQHALNRHPSLTTWCLCKDSFVTPCHYDDFYSLCEGDFYHLQIFSEIFHLLGYTFPARKATPFKSQKKNCNQDWKQQVKKLIFRVEAYIQKMLAFRAPILLWDIYFSRKLVYKIMVSTRLRAIPINLRDNILEEKAIISNKDQKRKGLTNIQADDHFQKVLIRSLSVHFPTLYLEGYGMAVRKIHKIWRKWPKVIMSSIGWHGNEHMKFVAAEVLRHGGKLLACQHGGGYGISDLFLTEKIERDITHYFYTWGWSDEKKDSRTRNLPSPKLSALRKKKNKIGKSSYILYVASGTFRYGMRIIGYDDQVQNYLSSQLKFFSNIPDELHKDFTIRLFPHEYGLSQDKRLLSRYPTLKIDNHSQTYLKRLEGARLIVFDHLSTTFLEALNCNIPLIVFNGSKYSFFRKEAWAYIEKLREAGIFYENALDAATKTREIFYDPWGWWQQSEIQAAKDEFCFQFARTSNNWLVEWKEELLNLVEIQK